MSVKVSITLDDRIARYIEAQERAANKPPAEPVADLLEEWYEAKLRELHRQYLAGDLTLRGMARQLGLDYRELYDLMEQKGFPV